MGFRSGGALGSRRAGTAAVAAVLIGLVVVLVWTLDSDRTGRVPLPTSTEPTGVPPAVELARVVAAWLDRTARPAGLRNASRRAALVDRFVADEFREQMSDQLQTTADALEVGDDTGTELRAVPVGFRFREVGPGRAVVETQQVVLQASRGTMTAGMLATGRLNFVREDRWRISGADVSALPLAAVSRDRLAALDSNYTAFRHVP